MSLETQREHDTIHVTALAPSASAGISAAGAAGAAAERMPILILTALSASPDAHVAAARRVHSTIENLVMSTRVASDGHVDSARAFQRRWILVTLIVFAALAARGCTGISATSAISATLELGIVIIGAAERVCRHARMTTALLVARAMRGVTIVRAGLQHAPGDEIGDAGRWRFCGASSAFDGLLGRS